METIRSLAISVCFTLLLTGIFSMLIPTGKMEQVFKFAVSLFFLSSLVMPFVTGEVSLSFAVDTVKTEFSSAKIKDTANDTFLRLSQKYLESEIKQLLKKEGISLEKAEVTIHIETDDSITISNINLILSDCEEAQKEDAVHLVEKELGVTPSVLIKTEGIRDWYGRE